VLLLITTTHLLEEVPHYDYLGLRLDEKLTMSLAKEAVLAKVNKALIPVLAVVRSLKYKSEITIQPSPPHPSPRSNCGNPAYSRTTFYTSVTSTTHRILTTSSVT
jgi:hypothetical protein